MYFNDFHVPDMAAGLMTSYVWPWNQIAFKFVKVFIVQLEKLIILHAETINVPTIRKDFN